MKYGKEISADHHRLIPMIAANKLDHHSRKAKAEQQCGNVLFLRFFTLSFWGVRLMMFHTVIAAGRPKITKQIIARNIKPTMVLIILLT